MGDKIIKNSFYNVEPLTVTSELLDIADLLKSVDLPAIKKISDSGKLRIMKDGISVFSRNDLTLNKLPYVEYAIIEHCNLENRTNGGDLTSLISLLSNYVELKHPFEVPVIFDCNLDIEEGFFRPLYIGDKDKNMKLVFAEYVLTGKLSELTPGIYVHEIVHSQLENVNGVKSYLNYEVLTVFFDKLTALYLDKSGELLKKNEKLRFNTLKQSINLLLDDNIPLISKVIASMSVSSLLQAEHLFDRYMYGSAKEKQDIIEQIQNIFDGKIKVEDLLDSTDITFDNSQSCKLIKKHL